MDNLQLSQGGNFALASGALAAGTAAGTVKTTAVIPYVIDGQFYSKAITDNMAVSVTLPATWGVATNGAFTGENRTVQTAAGAVTGSVRLYGIYMDTAGALSFFPGPIAHPGDLANGTVPLQFPANRRGRVFIGAMRVQVNAGVTFVPGTNALGGTAATTGLVTFINCATIPGEPLRS
ncbi:MAG: hypothetical protein EKK53_21560 [Burkholderiales bacterium]|nr:MAG: hypothetical protein EKK53_21560 [Burkholderiales bacterium]